MSARIYDPFLRSRIIGSKLFYEMGHWYWRLELSDGDCIRSAPFRSEHLAGRDLEEQMSVMGESLPEVAS